MMNSKSVIVYALVGLLSFEFSAGKTSIWKKIRREKAGKIYKDHDPVHLVVNKIGPFNNPTETYRYYSLPFCKSHASHEEELKVAAEENLVLNDHTHDGIVREASLRHRHGIGEHLAGDRRESSPFEITYGDTIDWRLLCKTTLMPEQLEKFKKAILNNYYFEFFIEDLPMWGYIGDSKSSDITEEIEGTAKTYLFPHLHFYIGTNPSTRQIVSTKVTTDTDRRVDITDTSKPIEVKFSYSVEWLADKLKWEDRMRRYRESRFLPATFEIHWLSIINSFVLVLLLTAFLTIILLRVLKNDFSRYMELDDEAMEEEESGWKLIHGDVFRFPPHLTLFCACIGTGTQLIAVTLSHLGLALMGVISTNRRGSILAGIVILYCLLSFVGGYTAVSYYRQMNGKLWVRCILLTALLFPTPVVVVFMWVNSVALAHGSTSALPATTVLTCAGLFGFVSLPLTILGGICAKQYASTDFAAPTRTTKVAREIPTEIPWYRGHIFQSLIAGFLPFTAIYIELHYIFASMWGHQIYTLFGILFLAFLLLLIVTAFITVALLYFQLAREDYRWWWTSFVNGGMTGLLIYIYSFYYYSHRSGMSGILQTSFYFGYMGIISLAFFLMLGSTAFQFSLWFVKYIYSRVKCD